MSHPLATVCIVYGTAQHFIDDFYIFRLECTISIIVNYIYCVEFHTENETNQEKKWFD